MNVFWQKKDGQKEKHLTHQGLDKNIIGTVYNKKISAKNGFLTWKCVFTPLKSLNPRTIYTKLILNKLLDHNKNWNFKTYGVKKCYKTARKVPKIIKRQKICFN